MTMNDLYDAFLVLIESDEWENLNDDDRELDFKQLACAAMPWFKFPRCSFDLAEDGVTFLDDRVTNTEIQILAQFMKYVWYGRVVDSWENLRPYYTERDFSPGKMLAEYRGRLDKQLSDAKKLESIYYRSIKGQPFDYTRLVGTGKVKGPTYELPKEEETPVETPEEPVTPPETGG